MKKFLGLIGVLILAACSSAPQATLTSEAAITLTPIPTPTMNPGFAALLQAIADSGTRFTLQADGLIYDGETPIPGLTVAPDGTMTLEVNGESVTLDPADVDFDDENGITIDGYEWDPDANGGAGAWVEATETVTANFDLGVILAPGEANEDGSRNIETFAPPEEFADNEGAVARWLNYFDAERLGFDPGATQWILTEDGRAVLVDSADHSKIIAEWKDIPWIGKAGIVWIGSNFIEGDGENPLFDVCKNWLFSGEEDSLITSKAHLNFVKSLNAREYPMLISGSDMMYGDGDKRPFSSQDGFLFSKDGKRIVTYRLVKLSDSEGFLITRDNQGETAAEGKSIILYFEDMNWK